MSDLFLTCDAPPWAIIVACGAIGVERPADVKWVRAVQMFGCISCHGLVLKLSRFKFTYDSGKEASYSVAQCPKCCTVHWSE